MPEDGILEPVVEIPEGPATLEGEPVVEPVVEPIGQPPAGTAAAPPEWVRRRISEQTAKAQEFEGKYTTSQAEIEQLKRQVAALAGVSPSDPKQAERDELKQIILDAFPEMANVGQPSGGEDIAELKETVEFLSKRLWGGQATSTIEGILKKSAEGFGRDLSPEAEEILQLSFASWVNANPERTERYMESDDSLSDEFYALVDKGFISPTKTGAVIEGAAKLKPTAKLPQSGPGAALVGTAPKTDGKTLDDLVDEAFDRTRKGQ